VDTTSVLTCLTLRARKNITVLMLYRCMKQPSAMVKYWYFLFSANPTMSCDSDLRQKGRNHRFDTTGIRNMWLS
jgi:hypothetical protein